MNSKQELLHPPFGKESASPPQFNVKLFFHKQKKKVMYAECKHDIVDLLFSLLVYPVNCAIKYMGGESRFSRNFQNLHSSAIDLDAAGFLTGSPCTKKMLLEPSFAPFRMGFRIRDGDPEKLSNPEFLNDLISEKREIAMDRMYVVEDNQLIYQASAMLVIEDVRLSIGASQADALMRSVVTSKTALTDVFRSRMEIACMLH